MFTAEDLRLLDSTAEVEIRVGGRPALPIWIVVDGERVYIRSVRGPAGRWYQNVVSGAEARLAAGRRVWTIRTQHVSDQAEIAHVSRAIERKYQSRWPGPTVAMLRPEVLPTTLRVEPA